MSDTITGSCHCGTVQWQATLPSHVALNCHCNLCRSLSGADYSSWLIFPEAQFRILTGADNTTAYQATEKFQRTFCRSCGSTITCVNNDKFPQHIYVAKGNITSAYDQGPDVQVYTQDKASWVAIDEAIPVFNP